MKLAELLEEEGADIIQTEGGKCSTPTKPGVLGLIEKVWEKDNNAENEPQPLFILLSLDQLKYHLLSTL